MPTIPNKFLFHVTTYERARRIIDSGFVDPLFSQGKANVSWYTTRNKVTWAIAHVAQRHEVALADMAVITVKIGDAKILKTNRRSLFACKTKLPVVEMISVEMWLAREERFVHVRYPKRRE